MEVIVDCCAGLDVHQATVVACLCRGGERRARKEVRTFGTTKCELEAMRDWLLAAGCNLVAMESTGVFWQPIYRMLEGWIDMIVGNARHMKNVPGRKTDVKDCEWICDLARHGLIAPNFVPPRPIGELRDLTRIRRKLSQAQATDRNRLIKELESANIKLAGLVIDVFGVSGREMVRALIEGKETPVEMAQHARRRMRRKLEPLAKALDGYLTDEHRFLLQLHLDRVEATETQLERLDVRLRERLVPYTKQLARLMQIPSVNRVTAATIIAEIGVEMSAFSDAHHLASWAGLCPGNNRSAGKQGNGKSRKGNVHLKAALVTAAVAVSKTRSGYLREKHRRLKARRGELRAHVAIAHKILLAAWHILAKGMDYQASGQTSSRATPSSSKSKPSPP